jgi:hypothetical protein
MLLPIKFVNGHIHERKNIPMIGACKILKLFGLKKVFF